MTDFPDNLLLAALPDQEQQLLAPALEIVSLSLNDPLHEANDEMPYVYFPTSAAISMINVLEDGRSVEVAIVGREGFVGLAVLFNQQKAFARAVTQVPGEAARMKSQEFTRQKGHLPALNDHMARYATVFLQQAFTSSGCNHFHTIEQRIARWLLEHYDRSPTRPQAFPFTHDFLAEMLGAHRSSVTQVTDKLQSQGLIEYRRGQMKVIDVEGLAGVACECYHLLKHAVEEFVAALKQAGSRQPRARGAAGRKHS